MINFFQYKTIVFDCDGVILNSNSVKTEAFYEVASEYDLQAANEFVQYHVKNGGVSRYAKFAHFVNEILPKYQKTANLDSLLKKFAEILDEKLKVCEVANNLDKLRGVLNNSRWLVVSGGDQVELRNLFEIRNIDTLFDGGVFGSPDSKDVILKRELDVGNIIYPALFIGDSYYDYVAASNSKLDFVFLSQWSELADWQKFILERSIQSYSDISEIVNNCVN